MILRDYQQAGSDSIFEAWLTHVAVMAVMATGLGKTVLAADVIRRMQPKRTMFIAHREELIFQADDKIRKSTHLGCEIEMADLVASTSLFHRQDVVISTVQTQVSGMRGRMTRFDPNDFGLLVVDEVHHACAKTYRKVIDYYRQNPDLRVLGLTATPDRADEQALGQIFNHVAVNFGILEGIDHGWLVPVSQQLVRIKDLDFSSVRTLAGDLNGGDLALLMETEKNMQGVAGASIDIVGQRRAIVFTASVKQAETVCEIFNRHKPGCADWISGETDKDRRRDKLKEFANGKIQIICNCAVLTEGFDDCGVEVIVMARPTKSRSLYTQMCGRGTRPLAGVVDGPPNPDERKAAIASSAKPTCLVVDFTGNSGKHKLMTTADILGGNFSDDVKQRAKKKLESKGSAMPIQEALMEAEKDLQRESEEAEEKERERRRKIVAKVSYQTQSIDPFDRHDRDVYSSEISIDGRMFSSKQVAILKQHGINPRTMAYRQGQAILAKVCSVPSDKQIGVLRRAGYSAQELGGIDRKGASAMIDALAKNGWRKPNSQSPSSTREEYLPV